MSGADRGFQIVSIDELRKMRVGLMTPHPRVVLVNKREVFKPPADVEANYRDLMRRYRDDPHRLQFALDGSHYEGRFRSKIVRDGRALAALRKLAKESQSKLVLMVREENRPEAAILVDIATQMIGDGVW